MKTKFITLLIVLGMIFSQYAKADTTVSVGATGTYPSIAAAVAGVGTITEPLIIELKSDYAMTSDSILAISGASATNTVTIRPQSTLTVAGNGAYVWKMKGCQYVTIDGRVGGSGVSVLTLKADTIVGDTLKRTIALHILNDASNNTIKYVKLLGATTKFKWRSSVSTLAADRGTITIGAGIATGNTNITIDSCFIGPIHNYTGTPTVAIFSSGTIGLPNSNITVSNNNIYDYFAVDYNKTTTIPGSGVGVLFDANTTASTISGNSFYQTLARTQYGNANGAKTCAIAINNIGGSGFVVKNNYIGGSLPLCGGTLAYTNQSGNNTAFIGIYMNVSPTATPVSAIYGNTIKKLALSCSASVTTAYQASAISVVGSANIGVREDGTTADGNIIGDQSAATVGANASIQFVGTNNNASFSGIVLNNAAGATVKISNNKIAGLNLTYNGSRTSNLIGVNVISSNNVTAVFSNNEIGNSDANVLPTSMSLQSNAGKPIYGFNIQAGGSGSNYTFSSNKISNIYNMQQGTNQTYVYGIWIATGVLCPVTINNNQIKNLVYTNGRLNDTPVNWTAGIMSGSQGTSNIYGNTISGIYGLSVSSFNTIGVNLQNTNGSSVMNVYNNSISNLASNVTRKLGQYATGSTGIFNGSATAVASTVNVYNNMIGLGTDRSGSDLTSFNNMVGIRDSVITTGAAKINYYNNTINIGGSNVASSDSIRSFGICFATGAATSAVRTAKNNLIINARSNTSGGANHYAIGTLAASTSSFTSDYNDLYVSGIGGNIGYITGTAQNTLANWKTASSKDANSVSTAVTFASATDLSLSGTSALNTKLSVPAIGSPVTTDYFANARHTPNVYVGAHEPYDINQSKTFTVTTPQGTEHVYIAGSFTGKAWDITDPLELTPTTNAYEFSGTFLAANDVSYKYLCQKGNWDYQEASSVSPLTEAGNHSYNASDVVTYWKAMPKIKLNVSIASGGTPSNLYVKGGWNGWSTQVALTPSSTPLSISAQKAKSASTSYTGVIGNGTTDVIYANTEYKYYTTDLVDPNWEVNADGSAKGNRWSIYPLMSDEIARFATQIATDLADAKDLNLRIMRTSSGIAATFDGDANIELYNINGSLIEKTKTTGSYSHDLQNGAYIIRINDKTTKFVK